ncbi:3-deoxy-D-manno-octulosonic acid transferase, partial [bacterium]|nr:3-deoxy-D-manno-octulosonic acid transferase [bacterium]
GSTWPLDEEILCRYINESVRPVKWILVPHEIHPSHIQKLKHSLTKKTLIFTESGENDSMDAEVLIIDTIGLLSSLYQYGKLAYIGGGFGKGIHNTLEAATFGLPVIFGPRFNKFTEAKELVQAGAGYPVHDYAELKNILNRIFDDPELLKTSGKSARDYVFSKLGATRVIVNSTLKS